MIELVPLGEEEYRKWYDWAVEDYARDIERAGTPPDAARGKAKADFEQGLPDGLRSKDQYLYSLRDSETGNGVGIIWFALTQRGERKTIFLYDILVYEPFQGKGFGRQAMLALEDRARELGAVRIGLHVFGHNERARRLYTSLGYIETNINMAKDLEVPSAQAAGTVTGSDKGPTA